MKKLAWYHGLGFFDNPFSIKPAAFDNELMGYDGIIGGMKGKLEEPGIMLLCGKYGAGKTTILKHVLAQFRGKRRVIYYSCGQNDGNIDFDRLLLNAGGFFRKLFRIRKKGMIILLDEAQDMGRGNMERLKQYFDEGFFKSVIFVGKSEDEVRLTKELKELARDSIFRLGDIPKNDAVALVRKRIGNLKFISDEQIAMIFRKNRNPRALLKNCEEVCRIAFEQNSGRITDRIIKRVR